MTTETSAPLILVVEDNTLLRDGMREFLEFAEYKVITASNGPDALNLLHHAHVLPALIVSDIRMVNMNGYEFLSAVRNDKRWRSIPFLFISGKEKFDTDKLQPADLKAVDYLPKPFAVEDLLSSVENALTQEATTQLRESSKQTNPLIRPHHLVIYLGDSSDPLTVIPVHEIEEFVLGRSSQGESELPALDLRSHQGLDKGVSRRHASIIWWKGILHIVDKDSANGTTLNDLQLTPFERYMLRDGDLLRLGDVELRIQFAYADSQ